MHPSPLLSFCIPSYNRLVRVKSLVQSLLSLPDDDIEVIVLDNSSTDGTFEELKKIVDPRFKLAVNSENMGALFNMVNVFGYATGEYLVYSTDQDQTNIDRIGDFKAFLRLHPDVSCGFCEFNKLVSNKHRFYPRGYLAVSAIAYKGRHPTGYFFRRDHLSTVRIRERLADYNFVDLFPLDFAFAEVSMLGNGAIYSGGIFSPNNGGDVVTHKSSTTNGMSENAFFAPAARLKLAVSYSRHVEQLELINAEKSNLLVQIFIVELRAATAGYRSVLLNERLCLHYRMEPRRIGYVELIIIGSSFISGYFSQRMSKDKVSVINFVFHLAHHIVSRYFARIAKI